MTFVCATVDLRLHVSEYWKQIVDDKQRTAVNVDATKQQQLVSCESYFQLVCHCLKKLNLNKINKSVHLKKEIITQRNGVCPTKHDRREEQ